MLKQHSDDKESNNDYGLKQQVSVLPIVVAMFSKQVACDCITARNKHLLASRLLNVVRESWL